MNKDLYVRDEFRTNSLSRQPGGYEVTVKYADGTSRIYDKVKDPQRYVSAIQAKGKSIVEVLVDGQPFDFQR